MSEERFDRIDAYLLQFRSEMIAQFSSINQRLEMLTSAVVSVDTRMPALTRAVMQLEAHDCGA